MTDEEPQAHKGLGLPGVALLIGLIAAIALGAWLLGYVLSRVAEQVNLTSVECEAPKCRIS